jgi:predicted AlkP superfamily pyrophosphatase or phosphodiesterase
MKITCKKSGINSKRTQQLYGVALFAAVLFFCSLWTAGCANNTPVAATTETTVSLPVIKADGTDSVLELAPYFTENQQTLAVDELLPGDGLLALYGADGSIVTADSGDCLLDRQGRVSVKAGEPFLLQGIIVNPPKFITQVAEITKQALGQNQRVMIIYLDGFGFDSYQEAEKLGKIPLMVGLQAEKVATVYPSITPVAFAAMVTGQTPDITGVRARADHQPACSSIFDLALAQGRKTFIVEGDKQIIKLAGEAEFNPDMNGDGSTDDEVFAAALSNMEVDLLLVHFHGIDDACHNSAPHSQEALTVINKTDELVRDLCRMWPGKVIITADHGQHEVDKDGKEGNHGDFRASDLFIPLLTREAD